MEGGGGGGGGGGADTRCCQKPSQRASRREFSASSGGRPGLPDLPAAAGWGLPRYDAIVTHFLLRSMARTQVLCSSIERAAVRGE